MMRTLPLALFLGVLSACTSHSDSPATQTAGPSATTAASTAAGTGSQAGSATATPAAGTDATAKRGGMWMPSQIAKKADVLKKLGLQIDPSQLSDPSSPLLQSVVSLGGCSASFVSPDGLIITNHHCVKGALAYHSTPKRNLVEAGFLAKTRAQEMWNGPSARVYITQKQTDVTDQMVKGLDQIKDDAARFAETQKREKALVAACEKATPHVRCQVASFFGGGQFRLIQRLEIKDVRMVYAPAGGVGWFGGDIDNWMWPRHTGDFGFFRAYVGKDGQPAEYSKSNVPYHSEHYLKLASSPLRAGDLVMVTGYPGSTERHHTAGEVDEAVSWEYPREIAMFKQYVAVMQEVGKKDKDAAVKAQPFIFGLDNYLKKYEGMMDGLEKGGLLAERKATEQKLVAWIDADAKRKATWGDVLPAIAKIEADRRATRDRDDAFRELGFARLYRTARTLVRMAEERAKPDAEREPGFQDRDMERLAAEMTDLNKHYNRALDRALLTTALQRATADLPHNQAWLALVFDKKAMEKLASGDQAARDAVVAKEVARLYRHPSLESKNVRLRLLRKATSAQLARSKDPLIRLAVTLRPTDREIEQAGKRRAGAMVLLRPRYIAALRAFQDTPLAPDANGTLRVTYGTVRGYSPHPGAPVYAPFTTLKGVLAKDKGEAPFKVPAALKAAAKKDLGPYVDKTLGDVPVDFLSDTDITNGNSGSPTLNAKGELCGLAFDGDYEAMASDWVFLPALNRTIHVDIRYVEWIMDAVDGADNLLKEMGVTPSL